MRFVAGQRSPSRCAFSVSSALRTLAGLDSSYFGADYAARRRIKRNGHSYPRQTADGAHLTRRGALIWSIIALSRAGFFLRDAVKSKGRQISAISTLSSLYQLSIRGAADPREISSCLQPGARRVVCHGASCCGADGYTSGQLRQLASGPRTRRRCDGFGNRGGARRRIT